MAEARALAVITFDVANMRLALDLEHVVEISLRAEITPLPGVAPPVSGVLRWRGRPLMAVELRRRLNLPARDPELSDHLVIARTSRRMLALEVDRVVDVDTLDLAAIRGAPPSARPLAGLVSTREGVNYVMDLEALLELEEERAFDAAISAEADR